MVVDKEYLSASRLDMVADLHRLEGAISFCDLLLARLDESEPAQEQE